MSLVLKEGLIKKGTILPDYCSFHAKMLLAQISIDVFLIMCLLLTYLRVWKKCKGKIDCNIILMIIIYTCEMCTILYNDISWYIVYNTEFVYVILK